MRKMLFVTGFALLLITLGLRSTAAARTKSTKVFTTSATTCDLDHRQIKVNPKDVVNWKIRDQGTQYKVVFRASPPNPAPGTPFQSMSFPVPGTSEAVRDDAAEGKYEYWIEDAQGHKCKEDDPGIIVRNQFVTDAKKKKKP